MIKLVFSGDLITGFAQDQVVDNLSRIVAQPAEIIRQKMFSGKPVIIKKVDSKPVANKWRQRFADAGAVLVVLEPRPEAAQSVTTSQYSLAENDQRQEPSFSDDMPSNADDTLERPAAPVISASEKGSIGYDDSPLTDEDPMDEDDFRSYDSSKLNGDYVWLGVAGVAVAMVAVAGLWFLGFV